MGEIQKMNKKPAFWLILAAVAACIVVAICFLTSLSQGRNLSFVDLNRNGIEEELRLVKDETEHRQIIVIYENGEQIFYEEGFFVHSGWNALFLCTLEGEDYLLRYSPVWYSGSGGYFYELFTLENGQENVIRSNGVSIDLNFEFPDIHEQAGGFEPDAIAAFMEEINGYLAHSRQLLNTNEDLLRTFEKAGKLEDNLSVLDYSPNTFVRDDTKSLLENLREFKKAEETKAMEYKKLMETESERKY